MLRIGVLGAAYRAGRTDQPREGFIRSGGCGDRGAGSQARKEFADKHGIEIVHKGYGDLIADPSIDAVYNPLPNGLHGRWTMAALVAGKHVLCEKPYASNASEARTVAKAARESGLVVMEAFHYRYHPLFQRAVEIVQSGELGTVQRIETALCFPLPKFSDIRYRFDLGGGATMDAGCYAIMARSLGGSEPEVVAAKAKLRTPNVDRAMTAELRFEGGHTARFERRSTYENQPDAFTAAVPRGGPVLTPPEDSIANMTVIDAVYAAAGLPPRQPT